MKPILLLAGMVCCTAQALASAPAPVQAWNVEHECGWRIDDENHHRASIESSSDGMTLTVSDPSMSGWSESEFHRVVVEFDANPRRSFQVEGWVSQGGEARLGMFGAYLDRKALRMLAGASRIRLLRGGQPVFDQRVANTPDLRELVACMPPPNAGKGDSE